MGIRFYCPNGHKLNVKQFQAGQTGVCPRCGAAMPIPEESTRRSSKKHSPHLPPQTHRENEAATTISRPAVAADQAGGPMKPPPIPAEPPRAANDPLAEGAKVVWYVRLASGEQLGPAAADVMRGWLAEGRITADVLVWREGWRDWRSAGGLFRQLSPNPPIPGLETVADQPLVTPIYPHHVAPHAPPRRTQFVVIGGLLLVLLLLLTVLLIASRQ
jgi:hypothetical protein